MNKMNIKINKHNLLKLKHQNKILKGKLKY